MTANLFMIAYDLEAFDIQGKINARRTRRTLAHPQACKSFPIRPRTDALMIIAAEKLPKEPPECAKLSIICIGEPPQCWQTCQHDVLWVPASTSAEDILNAAVESFWRYSDWERRLLTLAEEGAKYEEFAKASQPLFKNPLSFHSASFRIIFRTFPEEEQPSDQLLRYRNYTPKGSEYLPEQDVSLLANDPGFLRAIDQPEVTLFRAEAFSASTLMYNIRIGGTTRAYLSIDDVLASHTARDEALLKILGDILTRVVERDKSGIFIRPRLLGNVLTELLDHKKLLSDERIEEALAFLSWQVHNQYVVASMVPRSSDKAEALSAAASAIARALNNDCVVIHEKAICCVINLTQLREQRAQTIERLEKHSAILGLCIGVSEQFDDFRELYYYHQQAEVCIRFQQKTLSSRSVSTFEEHAIDYALEKIADKSIAGVFVPHGLKRLIEHDESKGTDFAHLLEAFLSNERHIAKTINQEYLHRNTFDYRIKRVKDILAMDLDDPDVRFRLLIAFRLMNCQNQLERLP